ncbi:hypothetical protein WJX82_002373 [Trebouxia sp. C0006]
MQSASHSVAAWCCSAKWPLWVLSPAHPDGPCSSLSHTLPLTFPTSTGCITALGQCSTTLTVTLPANCMQVPQPGGSPTVLMFAGYQVPTKYYHSLAKSLAANGYAVIQYERATIMPAADVESAYFEPLMQWRSSVNTTASSPFYGAFAESLAVAGHSMGGGMAAVAAGSHPSAVSTAFLMDPVDWNLESNRVDSQYLTRFAKSMAIVSVGTHCLDRSGCYAPTNCTVPISTSPGADGCSPTWWCCDWDHGVASASGRITQGAKAAPNGAQSFWAAASDGSWQINLPYAGHMSFLDYDPATDPDQLLSCPYTHPHTDIQPTVESMLVTWMNHAMLGQPLGDDWEATEGGFLDNKSGANTQ